MDVFLYLFINFILYSIHFFKFFIYEHDDIYEYTGIINLGLPWLGFISPCVFIAVFFVLKGPCSTLFWR